MLLGCAGHRPLEQRDLGLARRADRRPSAQGADPAPEGTRALGALLGGLGPQLRDDQARRPALGGHDGGARRLRRRDDGGGPRRDRCGPGEDAARDGRRADRPPDGLPAPSGVRRAAGARPRARDRGRLRGDGRRPPGHPVRTRHGARHRRSHSRRHTQDLARGVRPRALRGGVQAMSKTQGTWGDEVAKRLEGMVALRRDFHRHPELSFTEQRTSHIIAERLTTAGLEVKTGIAKTGVVGILRGDTPGKTIAWRADIDALPLTETLRAPFTSGAPGVMHACGHDGHTAIAITLAEILAARRRELPGTAVFLCQPAEEILGGAQPMIDAGVLDNPHVEQVYGLHLTTTAPAGYVTARPGPARASADAFTVEVRGRGGHGAMPHLSVDPITTAANILLGMQNLVSREVPAQETAVLTIGQLVSGTKSNIIPDRAFMTGTLRAFDEGVRRQSLSRLEDYVSHIGQAYRTQATLKVDLGSCPTVVNHQAETDFMLRAAALELGEEAVGAGKLVMASDDMSLFLQA